VEGRGEVRRRRDSVSRPGHSWGVWGAGTGRPIKLIQRIEERWPRGEGGAFRGQQRDPYTAGRCLFTYYGFFDKRVS